MVVASHRSGVAAESTHERSKKQKHQEGKEEERESECATEEERESECATEEERESECATEEERERGQKTVVQPEKCHFEHVYFCTAGGP